ncbi:hypothetical protein WA026_001586 [Henosepilachna vigintioctopunctata]|uniref:Ankyrin repeat protein n=1 Tax=Henosepilachna vigintioctopunctata TaxID=420089 RepID=A0AAW1UTU9_9CUCU
MSVRPIEHPINYLYRKNGKPRKVQPINLLYSAHINCYTSIRNEIDRGGDINSVDRCGNTPLHLVCLNVHDPRCVRYLLTLRPNVNAKNIFLETPLNIYLRNFRVYHELVNIFLKLGADPNIPDALGNIAFHNLAGSRVQSFICLKEITRILIKYNAKVNVQNRNGDTPLHLAIRSNRSASFIRMLLDNGASILIKNKENITPIDLAYRKREWNSEIFREIGMNMIILQSCNIPINQDILRELYKREKLKSFEKECQKAVLVMKKITFGYHDITLFDIFNSSTITFAKYLRSSEMINSFQYQISYCSGILVNRLNHHFKESLARREAEDDVVPICMNIFKMLNEDCINHLITFLGKDDLDNIKYAYMERNPKEKIYLMPA